MKKVFYEKIGKRYKPVKEYDSDLLDAFYEGATLVICKPGSKSFSYNIEPKFAPMIAAGKYAEDAMVSSLVEALYMRPSKTPITERQRELWNELQQSFAEQDFRIHRDCSIDVVRAGVKAMEKEAERMMANPAVKNAYDQFMLVWELTKEKEKHESKS